MALQVDPIPYQPSTSLLWYVEEEESFPKSQEPIQER